MRSILCQPSRRCVVTVGCLFAVAVALAGVATAAPNEARTAAVEADPMDWPSWRGPEQNGISRETGLIDEWDPDAEGTEGNVLWKNTELGGISTPIVLRGKLYTTVRSDPGTNREGEKVVCVDAATGEKIWENKFNVFLTDMPSERIGWACCTGDPATGKIYAIGSCAYLHCIDGETGKTLWKHSLNEEYGFLTTYGGRLTTPVLFEDLVIVGGVIIGWGETARPTHRQMAFDKSTGELIWITGTRPLPDDTTYSTPVTTVLKGQAAMVFGSGDGAVHAFQPRTGEKIWEFQLSRRGLNVSPVIADDRVYTGQGEENLNTTEMGAIICIDGSKSGDVTDSGELWRQSGTIGKCSPLLIDGRVYAFDDRAKLHVVDAATGKLIGRRPARLIGTRMRSSPVYADGKIYACTENAWHVLQPTKDGVKIINRMRLDDEIAGSPIVSHGRIYLPTGSAIYCLGRPDTKPAIDPRPEPTPEDALGENTEVAHVQLIPAETLMKPGDSKQFKVKLYNDRGQFLKEGSATFSLDGEGEIDDSGKFVAPSGPGHTATIVKATVDGIEGRARVRVVPDLPWKFDFEAGDVPITWVGARYRNVIREVDGDKVMVKVTTIPKGTRSQLLMGPDDHHDYTIQADVYGVITDNKMPDIGLIAQRYTMDLMGTHQKIQLRSWTSQLGRFSKDVPFAWDGDTWYTMKLQASNEDGKAVLRGKVWKRGEKEPDEWTIEATDEAPNTVGSPGLFGNAQTTEIFVDNVSVREN